MRSGRVSRERRCGRTQMSLTPSYRRSRRRCGHEAPPGAGRDGDAERQDPRRRCCRPRRRRGARGGPIAEPDLGDVRRGATMASPTRNPAAGSRSSPGVHMVMDSTIPSTRIPSGSSVARRSARAIEVEAGAPAPPSGASVTRSHAPSCCPPRQRPAFRLAVPSDRVRTRKTQKLITWYDIFWRPRGRVAPGR